MKNKCAAFTMGCIRIVIVRVVGGTMHYTGRVRSREINEQTNYFIYYVAFCVIIIIAVCNMYCISLASGSLPLCNTVNTTILPINQLKKQFT